MKQRKILMVLTSHSELPGENERTGFHYEEMTTPYYVFAEAGLEVDLASIEGGKPPHDPASFNHDPQKRPKSVNRFIADDAAVARLNTTKRVADVNPVEYAGIFLVGGHGTMWDFPNNAALEKAIRTIYAKNGVVGAVCHGPAGFIGVRTDDGFPLVGNRRICCFTNEEEEKAGKQDVVPFLLESKLSDLGAIFVSSPPSQECVAEDGRVVTGQNPASAKKLAETMVRIMEEYAAEQDEEPVSLATV